MLRFLTLPPLAALLSMLAASEPPASPLTYSAPAPWVAFATDSVRSDAEIHEVAVRHAGGVRRCYETEGLRRNAGLRGLVEVELTILAVGRVQQARVTRNDMEGPGAQEVGDCIAATARNWRFGRGPYTTDVIVLPFTLIPTVPNSAPERANT